MEKKKDKKIKFVSYKTLKRIDAEYIILLGQRSNGKSYAVKELCLRDAYEKGEEFAYLRRYDSDVKDYLVTEYFEDFIIRNENDENKIMEITNGEYDTISAFRKNIYFAVTDPVSGKVTRCKRIGRMFDLSGVEHHKSLQYPNITKIVYEEFVTKFSYLPNEPSLLFNLTSTIFRMRKGKVFCIGNTVSRICPYFGEWGLVNISRQKIGTIDIYNIKTDSGFDKTETHIAVYLTDAINFNSGMFFGNSSKAIVNGVWETDEQPHLIGDIDDYNSIYSLVFLYDKNMFLCEFLQSKIDPNSFTWFVTPKTTPIQKNTRVCSNLYSINYLHTQGFKPLNDKESTIFNMLKTGKVCYSDNLTGTEFLQCYNMIRGRI